MPTKAKDLRVIDFHSMVILLGEPERALLKENDERCAAAAWLFYSSQITRRAGSHEVSDNAPGHTIEDLNAPVATREHPKGAAHRVGGVRKVSARVAATHSDAEARVHR
jgi:hypothetical protein